MLDIYSLDCRFPRVIQIDRKEIQKKNCFELRSKGKIKTISSEYKPQTTLIEAQSEGQSLALAIL